MKAKSNINQGLARCLMALGGLLAASCGSYQSTSYHDRQQTAENGSAQATASGMHYQDYFGSLKEDYQVMTDVDNYSSTNDSTVVADNTGYAARPSWGSNPDNVTINIYDTGWGWNSWYGPGLGWGWNYGWGWNSWYGPGWGWGWNYGWGWNAGWAWGGYYGPYWGGYYPYYGYGHYYPYHYNTPRGYNSPYYANNGGRRVYTTPGGRYGGLRSDYATGRRVYTSGNSGRGVRNYSTGRTYSTSTGTRNNTYSPSNGTRNNNYTPAQSGTRNNTYTPSRSSTRSYSPPASSGGGRSSGGSYGGGGGGRSGGGGGRR